MSKKPRITISLPPHIKEAVEQDAKHDRMPQSEVIDRILWHHYGPPNKVSEKAK